MTAVMEAPRAAEPAAGKADDLQAIVTRNIRVAMALRGVIPKALAASFCKIPRHVSNVFMLSVAELSSALLDFDMP